MSPGTAPNRSAGRSLLIVAFLLTVAIYGAGYVRSMTEYRRLADFFQEWGSARNYFAGQSIYTSQWETARQYLEYHPDPFRGVFVNVNGHPPACVLMSLPFGFLSYQTGFMIWNLLSIAAFALSAWLLVRTDWKRSPWLALLPVVALAGNPLFQHLAMGQLGLFLTLLIVGIYLTDQKHLPVLAGILLGTASAIKLFPMFLAIYFLYRKQWKTCIAAATTLLGWNAAAWLAFGSEAFVHYVRFSMPEVLEYRDWWANYSVQGFWYKLFDGTSGQALPLRYIPWLARLGSLLTDGALVVLFLGTLRRPGPHDHAAEFSLAVVVMTLLTPICWDHYFVLLLLPLVILNGRLPTSGWQRAMYNMALASLWLNPLMMWYLTIVGGAKANAFDLLVYVSYPFYAVIAIWGMCQALALQMDLQSLTAVVRNRWMRSSAVHRRRVGWNWWPMLLLGVRRHAAPATAQAAGCDNQPLAVEVAAERGSGVDA